MNDDDDMGSRVRDKEERKTKLAQIWVFLFLTRQSSRVHSIVDQLGADSASTRPISTRSNRPSQPNSYRDSTNSTESVKSEPRQFRVAVMSRPLPRRRRLDRVIFDSSDSSNSSTSVSQETTIWATHDGRDNGVEVS